MSHSWVEVDLNRLRENVRAVRSAVSPKSEVIFVVKANAYGHGLVPVAQVAAHEGVHWFAVVHVSEALALRAALPDVHLLVIGYADPAQTELLLQNRITPVVTDVQTGLAFAAAAHRLHQTLSAQLKVDTGMGRLGVQWDEVGDILKTLRAAEGLKISGVCSHFAKVEPENLSDACTQADRFQKVLQHFPEPVFRHLSSSRAALYFPEWDFDGVRHGIDLYGYGAADPDGRFRTRPVLQWKTRVVQVKPVPAGFSVGYYGTHTTEHPTQIATVAVGYADGYNRRLSNRGDVLIGGRRCAVVGRVSMNWITVDVGPDAVVNIGDEVVLLGEQGTEAIWAKELSSICQTIPYEILTGINSSLKRKYCGGHAERTKNGES